MKGDLESKGIDLVMIMRNVWGVRHKLRFLWQFMHIVWVCCKVCSDENFCVIWSLVSATVYKVILKFGTLLNWLNNLESKKFYNHETYMKASQLEILKLLLAANLDQRNLVQLCHFSLLCPLQSMHVLQHFTNVQTPHEKKKKSPGCMCSHFCMPCAYLRWVGQSFQ